MRIPAAALTILAASACMPTTTSGGACDDEPRLAIAACALPAAADGGPEATHDFTLVVDGTVKAAGHGLPAENGCLTQFSIREGVVNAADADWVTLEQQDGTEVTVAVVTPASKPLGATGDALHLDFALHPGGFGPTSGHLSLTTQDGTPRVFFAEAGSISAITPPPGLTFGAGDVTCTQEETCGTWVANKLVVTSGDERIAIATGASADVGGFRVHNGGLRHQTSASTQCADWFVADAIVAADAR